MESIINKTMSREDLDDPKAQEIIRDLNKLIKDLRSEGLKISSWYGSFSLSSREDSSEVINRGVDYEPLPNAVDDNNFPWFLYWEIVWLVLHNDFRPEHKILDMGGSSSLFSFYLANKGLDVTTIDLQDDLVENANYVAGKMNWKLKNYVMDMNHLSFEESFDHITSVCVFEHIPLYDRVEINKKIKLILKPKGHFSITFDYKNPSNLARISSPAEVKSQFIDASELSVRGNKEFCDSNKNYLLQPFYSEKIKEYKLKAIELGHFDKSQLNITKSENDYTFGALFMINL